MAHRLGNALLEDNYVNNLITNLGAIKFCKLKPASHLLHINLIIPHISQYLLVDGETYKI
jgi:hypothetical protein